MTQDVNNPQKRLLWAIDRLQLPCLVTKDDIKRQYRYLVKKHHPDYGGDEETMQTIAEAYAIIMEYIDRFRYRFDEDEIARQFPGVEHADRFRP